MHIIQFLGAELIHQVLQRLSTCGRRPWRR